MITKTEKLPKSANIINRLISFDSEHINALDEIIKSRAHREKIKGVVYLMCPSMSMVIRDLVLKEQQHIKESKSIRPMDRMISPNSTTNIVEIGSLHD